MSEKPVLSVGRSFVDDRGKLGFVNSFDPSTNGIRRIYTVENHRQGFIRAWHGHEREDKWVTLVSGAAMVCAVDMYNHDMLHKMFLCAEEPSVLWIPRGHANGFMSLTSDAKLMFFSNKTLAESIGDDIRFPYDSFGNPWEIEQR